MNVAELRKALGTENNGYHGFLNIRIQSVDDNHDVTSHGVICDVDFDEKSNEVVFTVEE